MVKKTNTQTWAIPATPISLDNNFDSSLGSMDAISTCYDSLLEYEYIPYSNSSDVLKENIEYNSKITGGFALKGLLAESWDLHKDLNKITFKIRKGVKSHWGNELTAKDIKWSWDRKLAIGGIGEYFASLIGLKKSEQVQIESKYAVTFKLDKPSSLILKVHRNPRNYIYDSKKIKESTSEGDQWGRDFISNNIAGFGPYKMASLERGKSFIAHCHKEYWGKKPSINKLVMLEVKSSYERVRKLKEAEVDISQHLSPFELEDLKKYKGISIDTVQSSNMLWINLNCNQPPFNNVMVRQAMNYAFPTYDAIFAVYKDYANVLEGVMPDFYPGYLGQSNYSETNINKARNLLGDAGYKSGFETYCIYDKNQFFMKPILEIYKRFLQEVGINLVLYEIPSSKYFMEQQSSVHPMKITRYAPWCADPGYALTVSFFSNSLGNYSHYNNDKVDKLIIAASSEINIDKRFRMLNEAQKIILNDCPWVLICNPNFNLARNKNLKGLVYRTFNHFKAQDFYWSKV